MNLSTYIKKLEQAGEIIRIQEEVSPRLEITEITDRFSKQMGGGKALLFEMTGTEYPVLINSLGSEKRIRIALGGRSPDELAGEIHKMISLLTGGDSGFAGKVRKIPLLGKAARWIPKRRRGRGASQEVINLEPDLGKLPVLTCWPFDGGPFITLPLVHTVDPVTGSSNLGMYRMQVFGPNSTGMHWHMHKTGARHYREYQKMGKKMPVAVALGGDPVYTYCATAPLPDGIDEYLLAGFIRNKPVTLVKCVTQELWVPEDCDFILEGYVNPAEPLKTEGPFGDHTGFYSLEDQFPVFHLTAITHRRKAIYPATIVGIPPQEDAWLAWVTERLFKPLIKMALVPELTDFHLPIEGVAHNLVLARITPSYPGQGRKVLHTLWGAGQMMFTKFTVITGDGPELRDYFHLARYISGRVDPSLHLEKASGPLDILDHSSREPAFGGKLGLDATGPEIFIDDQTSRNIDEQVVIAFRSQHPQIMDMNLEWIKEGISIGLISLRKTYSGVVSEMADEIRLFDSFNDIRFWIVFDDWVDLSDPHEIVWLTGSNVEVLSDVRIFPAANGKAAGMMFIDATVKTLNLDGFLRPWPNPTLMDTETIRMVDEKWPKYGVGALISSPTSKYSKFYQEGAVRKTLRQ
ncbi:MAG: menaquinone biosynthesis decarboxylase [Porphyromonadaceae bacterium]|nr:MAG: menaquinone biosynthesis decarboxylase [Porphyromonadaceae bacterium]